MNYKQFITKATAAGISPCEITYDSEEELSFSVFRHEIDNYSVSRQSSVRAKGIYNGKMGSASTEKNDASAIDYLIGNIRLGAQYSEKEETPEIFRGSEKYTKKNVFSKSIAEVSAERKKELLFALEQAAYDADSRVTDVQAQYEESASEKVLVNSYGLSLKQKSNYSVFVLQVVCRDGDQVKSGFDFAFCTDPDAFDPKPFAEKTVRNVVDSFGGVSAPSAAYRCVLSPKVTAAFLSAVVNAGFSAENIQKQSSVLIGKLGQKVFSSHVTVEEKPLQKNCFFRSFDDEGVACRDKRLVDRGIVKTWLYDLETARKDGVEPTGNGFGSGKIGIRAVNLSLRPGRVTEEQLFERVENGVYITSVSGLHAGLNPQSGDFSLEAQGFLIRDGKKAGAMNLFTCAGNIYKVFENVSAVANNPEMSVSGVTAPSVQVRSLKISSL